MEYYSSVKENKTIYTCNNLDEPQEHYVKWRKPISKGQILHNSILQHSQNDKILRDGKQIKTTDYQYTPIRRAKIKSSDDTKCG